MDKTLRDECIFQATCFVCGPVAKPEKADWKLKNGVIVCSQDCYDFMDCPQCSKQGIFNSAVKYQDGTVECGICEMGLEPIEV